MIGSSILILRRGDWLLCTGEDECIDEWSIFALVLSVNNSYTKIARWQSFGRLRISNATLPTKSIKRYYTKIGSFNKMSDKYLDKISTLVSHIPEDVLFSRNKVVFDYDKSFYDREIGSLESFLVKRKHRNDSLEKDILKFLYSVKAFGEESKEFLKIMQKHIEKLYKERGYIIYRSIDGRLEDVVKRD